MACDRTGDAAPEEHCGNGSRGMFATQTNQSDAARLAAAEESVRARLLHRLTTSFLHTALFQDIYICIHLHMIEERKIDDDK